VRTNAHFGTGRRRSRPPGNRDVARIAVVLASLIASMLAPAWALGAGSPANDDWAGARLVTAVPYADTVDATAATDVGDPFNYCGGGSATVWYRIELSTNARVEISTAGSDYDTVIDLHEWIDPPGAFAPRGCDNDSGPSGTSRLVADLSAGLVYAVMVSSLQGTPGGNLTLTVSTVPAPANDDFDMATPVEALPFHERLDAGSATSAADDPPSTCGGTGPSVWYDFTPDSDGRYAINTQDSAYDTLVTVYTGSRGTLSEVACNDNYMPIGSYQARLRFDAEAGTEYHVAITVGLGLQPIAGFLELTVAPAPTPPGNDDFDAATPMTELPFGEDLDTSEATISSDDPTPSCSAALESTVWYSITPTTADRISLQVRGDDFAPTVALYAGARGALKEQACSGGTTSSPGFAFDPRPNTTYHVLVGGATGDSGRLRIDAKHAFVVTFTIDESTVDVGSGVATISGTISCNMPAYISTDAGQLRQKVGRRTIRGNLAAYVWCDGVVPWTAEVIGDGGVFLAGKAEATMSLFGVSVSGEFSQPTVSKTITLKPGRA
jgi:hypothetical protein